MYNLIYMKKHHIFICYRCISFTSDLWILSSVSRFTFEEYEGNSAAAVGLKGMYTLIFFFLKVLCIFVSHPKRIVFGYFFYFFPIGQGCHILYEFSHKFLSQIFSTKSWKRLAKTCGEPFMNWQKLLFMNVYIRILTKYGRLVRKSSSLHGRKSNPNPKFIGTAEAYFCLPHRPKIAGYFDLCLHWVSVVRAYTYVLTYYSSLCAI